MDAAGRDNPQFGGAAGQGGRRLEDGRRVAVAGIDKRVERRAGAGLLRVQYGRADAYGCDAAGH